MKEGKMFPGVVALYLLVPLIRAAIDDESTTPHYLVTLENPCYLQYEKPIKSLSSNQDGLFEGDQTYPVCLCEKIEERNLVLGKHAEGSTYCSEISPIRSCSSFEQNGCREIVWLGSIAELSNSPGGNQYLSKTLPVLLHCSVGEIKGSATVAVEIDSVSEFSIGKRCRTDAMVEFLNQRIERHRKGSVLYYRIYISQADIEQFCDSRLFLDGTAMELNFHCTRDTPKRDAIASECMADCRTRNPTPCSSDPDCALCNFQTDLDLVDSDLQKCIEEAGYLIYWTQKSWPSVCPKVEPFPWVVYLSIINKTEGSLTSEISFTVEVVGVGKMDVKETATHGLMGVLIDKRTILTASHGFQNYTKYELQFVVWSFVTDIFSQIGVVSGGSDQFSKNLKAYRSSFIFDNYLEHPSEWTTWLSKPINWMDLAIVKFKKDIANIKPICLPVSQQSYVFEISKLRTTGWGTDPVNKPHMADILKQPTINAVTPLWGPSKYGTYCPSKCICLHIATNDESVCRGDSGTGLFESFTDSEGVTRWQVVGIQTKIWGADGAGPCTPYPQTHVLYNDLRLMKDWICDNTFGICGGYYLRW